jgi:hypothetical protein
VHFPDLIFSHICSSCLVIYSYICLDDLTEVKGLLLSDLTSSLRNLKGCFAAAIPVVVISVKIIFRSALCGISCPRGIELILVVWYLFSLGLPLSLDCLEVKYCTLPLLFYTLFHNSPKAENS